jgi:hypothetical protein
MANVILSCAELNFEAFDILVVSRTLLSRAIYSSYACYLSCYLSCYLRCWTKDNSVSNKNVAHQGHVVIFFSLQTFGMGYG